MSSCMYRLLRSSVSALVLVAMVAPSSHAQALRYPQWVTDGPVQSAVLSGDTLYMGGQFFAVARFTGGGFPASSSTASPRPGFPPIRGTVNAVVSDGAGGWYVGGAFTEIGGLSRHHLARLDASFAVMPWAPEPEGEVLALTLAGNTLYVGGRFTRASGQPRAHAAAFDKITGALMTWDPAPDGDVHALARTGNTVVLAGAFAQCGGAARAHVAAVSANAGLAQNLVLDTDDDAVALAVRGNTLYAGGRFTTASGQPRAGLAAWSLANGALTPFAPVFDGPVRALLASGNTLYVGGEFNAAGAAAREHVAAFDAAGESLLPFAPTFDATVRALALQGATLYVGGDFVQAEGQPRLRTAAVHATSGALQPWDPQVGYPDGVEEVRALDTGGASVFIGGTFDAIEPVVRERLAAIVLGTGALTPWSPSVDGLVQHLALAGDQVIVAGVFAHLQGVPRTGLGMLHRTSGALSTWNPSPDGPVDALLHDGQTLYVGGRFSSLSGQSRAYLGAFDLTTGDLLPWSPAPDYHVHALALDGPRLFVGGAFTTIGGAVRDALACLDRETGLATTWSAPGPTGGTDPLQGYVSPRVTALLLDGDHLRVGGVFAAWGAAGRVLTASFDAGTSAIEPWSPGGTAPGLFRADDVVNDLVLRSDGVTIAGHFSHMGGSRRNLATVDASTGSATTWDPAPDAEVMDLVTQGSSLIVLGNFMGTRDAAVAAVAQYVDPSVLDAPGPRPVPERLEMSAVWPSPMRSTSRVRFVLPAAGHVSVELYDVHGRLVRTLAREWRAAGSYTLEIPRADLMAGLYWLSVRHGDRAATRRVVVLP